MDQNTHKTQTPHNTLRHQDMHIYHLYPLSWGSPEALSLTPGRAGSNDRRNQDAGARGPVREPGAWADHIQGLGCNTILLGPVWKSASHGYDTLDYHEVDPRAGSREDLVQAVAHWHSRGMKVVIDGVFNHSARGFFAFRDLVENGSASKYRDWYRNLDFGRPGPDGVPFSYSGWHGHMSLPEFDLTVRDGYTAPAAAWLVETACAWIRDFDIDGLRLDAADCLDQGFMRVLAERCRQAKPGFWLMGEVIHGDYGSYVRDAGLDSVTNYEAYKGLWSSLNDLNYHEIAWTLKREFGPGGTCRDFLPATFVDNHDVSRVASVLKAPAHLYPLHCLAWTMPGIPGVYCGSETGWQAEKQQASDWNLRPAPSPGQIWEEGPRRDLMEVIRRLAALRSGHEALKSGGFVLVENSNTHLVFVRHVPGETLLVVVNAHKTPTPLTIDLSVLARGGVPGMSGWNSRQDRLVADLLNPGNTVRIAGNKLVMSTFPDWAQVYRLD